MDFSLVTAIQQKKVITFYYDNVHRTVEPHTYGQDKNGKDKLVAWQVSGKAGAPEAWREYSCDQISVLLSGQKTFAKPRDGYRRNDPQMSRIYAQL
jgi:hypothetical protein